MNKRQFYAAAGVVVGASMLCMTQAEVIRTYLAAKPLALTMPAMKDSVSNDGSKFELAKLLDTKSNIDMKKLDTSLVETADTAGLLTLEMPGNGVYMTLLETTLRPQRYMKGKLKVASPEIFEVLVNGESKQKKTAAQDSLSSASEITVDLELMPEADYEIAFRVLSSDTSKAGIKAEFIPDEKFEDVAVTLNPRMKKRFSIQDTESGRRVRQVSLSPNGKYLTVSYREKYSNDYTRQWADVIDTANGRTVASNLKYGIAWMPKGNSLYYTEDTKEGCDVYTIDISTMKHKRVIENLPAGSFYWSPDADYVLYYNNEEGKKESGPLRRYKTPDDRIPGNRARSFLMKYDLATGLSSPMVYSDESSYLLDISGDGKTILYSSTNTRANEYPFYFSDVILMDVNTFATDTIIKNEGFFTGGIFSPDSKKLFLLGGPAFFGGVGLASKENRPNDYDRQGFIMDIATRKVTPMTRDFDPSIDQVLGWNAKDGKIYFTANVGFYNKPYVLDPATGKISVVQDNAQRILSCSVGEYEDTWLAYCENGFDYAGRAYLQNLKNGKLVSVDAPFDADADKIDWAEQHQWSFTAKDGTVIDGYYFLPPDFDPEKKYPMIVYYYGGCSPTQAGITSPYSPQLFASRDYVVYTLNPSGTTGYGQEFSARHVNAWGNYTADEIIEGTKKFCEEHPFVNKDKIGCIGASYGGFMTQYLQTKTDLFACAVSHAGISNVASYWGEGYWGYSYNAVAASESYPWNNPDLFTRHGSLFNADKIHTPLLLLHGTADTNVPIGESIQLFNALKILGRDVEFISVDGENHFISDFPKRELWHAATMAWFAKYLQDDPRWWDSMYGN